MGRRLLAVAPNPSVDRLVEVDRLRRGELHRLARMTVVPGAADSGDAFLRGLSVATLRGDDLRVAAVLGTAAAAASAPVPGSERLKTAALKRLGIEIATELVG